MDNSPKVPHDWPNCPNIATELVIGKILPFKTPLDQRYAEFMKGKEFTIGSVFTYAKEQNMKLGLWVDLTFQRSYDKTEVEDHNCRYLKFKIGHFAPSTETTKVMVKTVKNFIQKNPDSIVGVHCNHGFNRTGFFIVSYMVEIHDWDVEEAISEFAKIRPPGIFRIKFLNELFKRYKVNHVPEIVPYPAWHKGGKRDKGKDNEMNKSVEK